MYTVAVFVLYSTRLLGDGLTHLWLHTHPQHLPNTYPTPPACPPPIELIHDIRVQKEVSQNPAVLAR